MHEFTNNFPEYGVLGNPDIPDPIELALYSADRRYSRKLGFRERSFSETQLSVTDFACCFFCPGGSIPGADIMQLMLRPERAEGTRPMMDATDGHGHPVRVSANVLERLDAVVQSGETYMIDPMEVQALAYLIGYPEAAWW